MKILKKNMLRSAAVALLGFGVMGIAQALPLAYSTSILDINNFKLLRADGTAYSSANFAVLSGTNDAKATAILNGISSTDSRSVPILSGAPTDVPQQCVGACPPMLENDFTSLPPFIGTFGYADQRLTGAIIDIPPVGVLAGARAQTRADTSLNVGGDASGNSDVGTSTTFQFQVEEDGTVTLSFDATPYTRAHVDPGVSPTTNANARLSWSLNIEDLTNDGIVYSFAPAELNALSLRSRTDAFPGTSTYAPGTIHFESTTPFLSAGNTYQITIQHNTFADALAAPIPEPGMLSLFSLGIGALAFVGRRKKARPSTSINS